MSKQAASKMNFRTTFQFRGDKQKIQWFPGHMMKGLRQMRQALLKTDCVIEVHDARIPLSGRNVNFQRDIVGNKPHILVLNKKDLVFGRQKDTKLQEKLKWKIMQQQQSLSDVIFTNCKDIKCKGLRNVSLF